MATNRRDYMREYQRKRRSKIKYESVENKQEEQPVDIKQKEAVSTVLNEFEKMSRDEDGESDPIFKLLKNAEKYAPLIQQGVKAVAEGLKGIKQQNQTPQVQQVAPPEGWVSMSPLQRYTRRYDGIGNETAWYRQGIAYEQAGTQDTATTGSREQYNIGYIDPEFDPKARKLQQIEQRAPTRQPVMDDVDRELIQQTPPPPPKAPQEQKQQPQQVQSNPLFEQMIQELQAEVLEKLQQGLTYVEELDDATFDEYIENPEGLKQKFSMYNKFMMSKNMKESLKQSRRDELINFVAEQAPNKFARLQEKEKTDLLDELLKMVQE